MVRQDIMRCTLHDLENGSFDAIARVRSVWPRPDRPPATALTALEQWKASRHRLLWVAVVNRDRDQTGRSCDTGLEMTAVKVETFAVSILIL